MAEKGLNAKGLRCEACTRVKVKTDSVCYCVDCKRKLCDKHRELHDDSVGWGHDVLPIDVYKQQATKLKVRMCGEHKSAPITIGCKVCKILCCTVCAANSQNSIRSCLYGQGHQFETLDSLEVTSAQGLKDTVQEFEKIKEAVTKQKDGVEEIKKELSDNVGKLMQQLEGRRLEQLHSITELYEEQKKRLIAAVDNQHNQLSAYACEIDKMVKEIDEIVIKVETDLPQWHAADVVTEEKDAKQKLLNMQRNPLQELDLPKLSFQDMGQSRTRNCELVVTESFINTRKTKTPVKMVSSADLYGSH